MNPPGPQLRDIHLPDAPGFWPPAPGWWLIALLLLAWLVAGVLWRRRRSVQRRLRRQLAQACDTALRDHSANGAALAAALSKLLRRAALRFYPPAAALKGEEWLCFLDAGQPARPFSNGPGRCLLDAPFRRVLPIEEVLPLVPLVRARLRWMAERVHRV